MPDTHLLLWTAGEPGKLSKDAREIMSDPANDLFFSAVSIWEVAIKRSLCKPDFQADPRRIRQLLLANKYREIPFTGEHGLAVLNLPLLHRDPFDRALIAQAMSECITLLTVESDIAQYAGPIRKV